jgi:hypothetical protein
LTIFLLFCSANFHFVTKRRQFVSVKPNWISPAVSYIFCSNAELSLPFYRHFKTERQDWCLHPRCCQQELTSDVNNFNFLSLSKIELKFCLIRYIGIFAAYSLISF